MQSTRLGLRIALLAGVSVVALAAASPHANAADLAARPVYKKAPSPPPAPPSTWTWWLEGGAFNTGGGGVGIPTFKPNWGGEGAVGFDWQAQPLWHVLGQFRYGTASRTKTANGAFISGPTPITLNGSQNLREDHWLVDFGIGRDFGLGSNAQWTFGVRVADLRSKLSINGTTTASSGVVNAQQKSAFVGAGPRFGVQGDIPLGGQWSFDWLAGAAVLFGERTGTFNATDTAAGGTTVIGNSSDSAAIFNADAEAGLSYWINPNLKITASYRYDEYFKALKTFSASTTNLGPNGVVVTSSNIDRSYSGPMLRLTSKF